MAQNIYRATDYEILPLNPDISVSSPPHPVEAHLLALVKSHLSSGNFLFSYAWDLTRRLQAQWASLKEDGDKPLWEVVSVATLRRRTPTHEMEGRRQVFLEQVSLSDISAGARRC